MKYQDFAIEAIQEATANLFKYAKAVPAEKLDWKPMNEGRSVLDMLQECAQSPLWFIDFLKPGAPAPKFNEADYAKMIEARKQWKTIAQCEKASSENSEKLFQTIRNLKDADLEIKFPVPWSPKPSSIRGMTMGQYWHLTYHLGQISYIQTLYGDKAMH